MAQQLYDVLGPHYPFGQGTTTAGISSDPCARASASGTVGTTSLAVTNKSGTFSDGDLVVIQQARASSDTDNWQVNQIVSGASGATFTLLDNLDRTFTSNTGSSAQRAQVVSVPEYLDATLNTFTGQGWTSPANYSSNGWGGLTAIAVRGTCTLSGTPNLNGKAGWPSSSDHNGVGTTDWYTHSSVVGGGFRPGWNSTDAGDAGVGEGYTGSFEIESTVAQGNGAGASSIGNGGGNGTIGVSGNGNPGAAVGNDSLSRMWFGGGGSGAKAPGQDGPASGGGGGGIFLIWAKIFVVTTGGMQVNGGAGGNTTNPPFGGGGLNDGGGGAGGSILINCEQATLGSGLITATGGTGNDGGGHGGSGRIRINYASQITGTTSPTLSSNQNRQLRVPSGMLQIIS